MYPKSAPAKLGVHQQQSAVPPKRKPTPPRPAVPPKRKPTPPRPVVPPTRKPSGSGKAVPPTRKQSPPRPAVPPTRKQSPPRPAVPPTRKPSGSGSKAVPPTRKPSSSGKAVPPTRKAAPPRPAVPPTRKPSGSGKAADKTSLSHKIVGKKGGKPTLRNMTASSKTTTPGVAVAWPVLDEKDIRVLQRYSIMNPRDVWGKNISRMKDAAYVEQNVPKFKTLLDILRAGILPSSRKPLVGKAIVYVQNKKDGLEALVTYLTSVGRMTPVRGRENTNSVKPGDNLLILGEISPTSPLYAYGATTTEASKGIVAKFNEPDNVIGMKYPVLVIHEKYMEGIDLKGVTHVILMQEPATPGSYDQIIGRAVRSCSHSSYPSSLWNTQIIALRNVDSEGNPTPDQYIEHNRERVGHLYDTLLTLTQENALDCTVAQKRYNRMCK